MIQLFKRLEADYPQITFVPGDTFSWSPKDKTVMYSSFPEQTDIATWSLLHEVSHGILGHATYKSDFELLKLETAAWQHARKLAASYGIKIDPDHIQDCLDTYRDWLHRRSTCPTCGINSLQKDPATYQCINCKTIWKVSNSRFCRPYRRQVL